MKNKLNKKKNELKNCKKKVTNIFFELLRLYVWDNQGTKGLIYLGLITLKNPYKSRYSITPTITDLV